MNKRENQKGNRKVTSVSVRLGRESVFCGIRDAKRQYSLLPLEISERRPRRRLGRNGHKLSRGLRKTSAINATERIGGGPWLVGGD